MDSYKNASMSVKTYANHRHKLADFFPSERYFLTKKVFVAGDSVLDIGGASGGLGNSIKTSIQKDIKYTCIDAERENCKIGKEKYPKFTFVSGYYPDALPIYETYDHVIMMALFPQIPEWKDMLLNMRKHARKTINLSCVVRLEGTTVIDKDVSYAYYFDSGQRVHQVVHNLYELLNFCSLEEMNLKKITFYGYHHKQKGKNKRCVPVEKQVVGNLFLEVRDAPATRAGCLSKPEFGGENVMPDNSPEIEIIIDGKKV